MFIFNGNTRTLRLTEIFHSIQGEGTLIGVPMTFVRTNRCNLRCKWCDSTYTFTGGYEQTVDDILKNPEELREEWVCLTGGEPLLQPDHLEFIDKAGNLGKKVLVETSGSLSVREVVNRENTIIDMDVKTPSSGEEKSIHLQNLQFLRSSDYIKFVIKDDADYDYSLNFIQEHAGEIACEMVFQPAWGTDLKWLTEKVLSDRLKVRVLPQLHKILWGEIPGV